MGYSSFTASCGLDCSVSLGPPSASFLSLPLVWIPPDQYPVHSLDSILEAASRWPPVNSALRVLTPLQRPCCPFMQRCRPSLPPGIGAGSMSCLALIK